MPNCPRILLTLALPCLVFTGCGRKEQSLPAAESGAAPAEQPVEAVVSEAPDLLTSEALAATTAPASVPETAPFFSERFLRPDQRLDRRQGRIRAVLETTATAAEEEEHSPSADADQETTAAGSDAPGVP